MSTTRTARRSTRCVRHMWLVGALLLAASAVEAGEASFVLRAKRVLTARSDGPWVYEPGTIIVRNGRIVAVGQALDVPPDLSVIDLPDATVMPGLVAASTSVVGPHSGDESVAAGYRAIDAFAPYADWTRVLAGGVTTVHLDPGSHRLLTGQGAVVKLGGPRAARVLSASSDLTINLVEGALDPPRYVRYRAPSSSDVALPVPIRQRPESRLGTFLALEEALAVALNNQEAAINQMHASVLAQAWRDNKPVRFKAQRRADIAGAVGYLRKNARNGYVVGGAEARDVASDFKAGGVGLVYEVTSSLHYPLSDVGYDPDALARDLDALAAMGDVRLALAAPRNRPTGELRLFAALARRAGLGEQKVIEAMTRVPAELLGVDDRVGSLAPGMDADLAVFTGDPLATTTHVARLYIAGELVFEAPDRGALVVRAGTIWLDEEHRIHNGAVLIEDGKITSVGRTVPHPPFARFIDAGPDGFVTPGLIDAHGHLGFDGDRSATAPDISPAKLVGVQDVTDTRVAMAGVTTVMLSSYSATSLGSQVAAVKTAGTTRAQRIVRSTAGVVFDFRGADPAKMSKKLKKRLDKGKKYLEKWRKYEKDLAEWKEKRAKGETVSGDDGVQEATKADGEADPITGTWSITISGGPLPEPQTATMRLRLTGDEIEGRMTVPGAPEEAKVVATLDDKHISGEIQIDTGGMGYPTFEGDIVEEDHVVGVISFQGIDVDLDATRIDKAPVVFKVVKRKSRGKDGRPLPPKVDESLEPLRAVLDQKIPLLVAVRSAAQIDVVLKTAESFEISVVILGGDQAQVHAEVLAEKSIGVVLPTRIVRKKHNRWYHQADDLARRGVPIGFQSDAEDGARSLPLVALRAVERGLSPDAALAALTIHAGKMYKLEDRIGSLKVGADGDLVVFTGHPFEAGSRVDRVIVNGKEVR